jgi:hypothetical protein
LIGQYDFDGALGVAQGLLAHGGVSATDSGEQGAA